MLSRLEAVQVLAELSLTAFLIKIHCVVEGSGAQTLPCGAAWAESQRDDNGQHDKQRLRQPERKKDS